jgi:hypothetical protein
MTKSLKSVFIAAVLLIAVNIASAQTKIEWKEMVDFHKVMSQTFHPLEEGNYQPIRDRIGEMVEKATLWQNSPIPEDYTSVKGIKKNLKLLVKNSSALEKKIKSGCSDEVIAKDLTKLHDVFHNIIGLCTHDDH